ncbi:MAG: hypothetical protein HKN24_13390 [Acidimicrobiales bacterium]|nr:hypothetical protein [Acidimicrobiales bacterium]
MYEPKFTPPATAGTNPPEVLSGSVEESVATSSTVAKSGLAGRLAVGGLVAVLGLGGAYAARSAMNGPAGPASSDEAVTLFFEALDNDDLVGLVEVIHPAERESIAEPMFAMLDHSKRLEIMAETADGAPPMIDFEVDGLTYSVEATGPRLHYVTTTGGTVTTPDDVAFPAGPLFDRFDIDVEDSVGDSVTTEDLGENPMKMAVVEEDGSWYVSVWYSVAEDARREAEKAFPGVGSGPAPVGAASPDAVLEDMLKAMADLDAEGVLTLLDPEEAGALYDYHSLYMGPINEGLAEMEAEAEAADAEWSLDSIDFEAVESNGRQIARFVSMEASFSVTEWDGTVISGSIKMSDGCAVVAVAEETIDSCEAETDERAAEIKRIQDGLLEIADLSSVTLDAFDRLSAVETGFTVVERNGRWYLSLMPTVLESVNDHLAVLQPEDLVAMGTDIEELIEDQERVGEELVDLLLGSDFELLAGGVNPIIPLGEPASNNFVPVSPPITIEPDDLVDSDDDWDWDTPELGELEDLLVPNDGAFALSSDNTYLSWEIDMTQTPAYVRGAYVFGENDSLEVLEFAGPIDPGLFDENSWNLTDIDGVVVAEHEFFGQQVAFVGNYVVWSVGTSDDTQMFFDQIVALQ